MSRVRVFSVAPLCNPILIFFAELRLELRDEDLKDEEFQMSKACLNSGPTKENIREEDLNIDWTDKEKDEDVEDIGDSGARVQSDDKGVGHMFGSINEMSQ